MSYNIEISLSEFLGFKEEDIILFVEEENHKRTLENSKEMPLEN